MKNSEQKQVVTKRDIYEVIVSQHTRKDDDIFVVGTFRNENDARHCFEKNVEWAKEQFKQENEDDIIEHLDGENFYCISIKDSQNSIEVEINALDFDKEFDKVKNIPPYSLFETGL